MKEIKIGDFITLKGTSQKGKNRVRELGDKWRVLNIKDKVMALGNQKGLFIAPDNELKKNNARWMNYTNDKDFKIV